jgi:hypothetical protein
MPKMIRKCRTAALLFVLITIIICPPAGICSGQQGSDDGARSGDHRNGAKPGSVPGAVGSRNPADLEARVEELTRRVEELSRMVEILAVKAAVASGERIAVAANQVSEVAPQTIAPSVKTVPEPLTRASSVSGNGTAAPQSAPPSAKSAAAETQPRSLGPFRFGGDFRLRLDGIVRPASDSTPPGQPPLPHVQNIRGRYRFRFNIDTEMGPAVSFHAQLATGPANNPLTLDQDFTATIVHHPFFLNEAWADIHPWKGVSLQGGRVQEVFADNLRFLFDDDLSLNGFNERISHEFQRSFAGFRRIEIRAGQYVFTNPNIAVVTADNIGATGAVIGSTGRAAQLFHQGLIVEQGLSPQASQQFGADIQAYRNPNQIQFASSPAGVPILVQNGLGLTLSGPVTGTGNAITTSGGSIYNANNFQVARLTYRLDYTGLKSGRQEYPVTLNLQVARNLGTGHAQRDALLANFKIGKIKSRWDHSFHYMFALKGANSMISQLTDDDLGTLSGVNIRTHFFRFDLGLAKGIQFQSLLFTQKELSNSGQFPNFFVPLGGYAPRQYRFQEQVVFVF